MSKNKLKKFDEISRIPFVFQYPFATLAQRGFNLKGLWHREFFHNDNPIVVELGCGKGEYTVDLARRIPDANFIGIDIKGARMHTGATRALDMGLPNVAFLRTSIELLPHFFAPGEVAEIWITFPDPQMKKVRKRLTSTRFLELYRQVIAPQAIINLKTDSPFLYTYTRELLRANPRAVDLLTDTDDLYADNAPYVANRDIRTHYEKQWLSRGLSIKYLRFKLLPGPELTEPDVDIPFDTYRSYSRGIIDSMPQLS